MDYKSLFLHFLIVGPTGQGKTSQILLPALNQFVKKPDFAIIVIEPKGDLTDQLNALAIINDREVDYFDPLRPDSSIKFNPLFGDDIDRVISINTEVLMSFMEDSSMFFKTEAEKLINHSIRMAKRLYGNDTTYLDVNSILRKDQSPYDKFEAKHINQYETTYAHLTDDKRKQVIIENEDIMAYMKDYYAKDSKTYEHTSGARSIVFKIINTETIRKLLCSNEDSIDLKALVDRQWNDGKGEQRILCINTATNKFAQMGELMGRMFVLTIQAEIFARGGNPDSRMPLILMLDEAQKYLNSQMEDAFTQFRSYGASLWISTQNLNAIKHVSEKLLDIIKSNARNRIFLPGINEEDAKFISDYFGTRTVIKKSKGKSYRRASEQTKSENETEQEELVIKPSTFTTMRGGEILFSTLQGLNIMPPIIGKADYIDNDLNDEINAMIDNEDEQNRYKKKLSESRKYKRNKVLKELKEKIELEELKQRTELIENKKRKELEEYLKNEKTFDLT